MTDDLLINRQLIKELLGRITDPDENVRHEATEALALIASDADWRPAELIEDNGIVTILDLLDEENVHILASALDIIIATADAGGEEDLISAGAIAALDELQDHEDTGVRGKVKQALWMLEPQVEDTVISKPQDDY
jgi:hypothetical protein